MGLYPKIFMVVGDVRNDVYMLRTSSRKTGLPPSISLVAWVSEPKTPAICGRVVGCVG